MENAFEDALERLEIEYEGIRRTVRRYISEGLISNYFEKLKQAISQKNIKTIKYCLSEINRWYTNNITEIRGYDSYNIDSHLTAMRIISELNNTISIIPDNYVCQTPRTSIEETEKNLDHVDTINTKTIIFISHSSSDKKYGDTLRKFIIGLGVKDEQLIYTSHPLNKIPLDKNIYEYLRENFNNTVFMIILWSDAYLESPACLNEMGAAWVTQSDYTNIYVPDFEFGNPKYHECAVDTRKMGAVLKNDGHCKTKMIELKNKILKMFNLEIDEKHFMVLLDEFMKEIV